MFVSSHVCAESRFVSSHNCDMFLFLSSQSCEQVLWTYTGRKMLPPSTSLPVMGEIAGVNTASLGGYLHISKTRAGWAEGFDDELNSHLFDLERDGLRQVVPCPRLTIRWKQATIPYRISQWRKLVVKSAVVPQRPSRLRD